jgi:uncharacterized protein
MGAREKAASARDKILRAVALDRRSFLAGGAAILLDPPIPSRQRIRVAVFGDSASDGLWYALREETPKTARYSFMRRSKSSSGLTQPSFYDWPAKAKEMAAAEDWGAAIVLLGLNDNLPIKLDTKWKNVGEPGWRQAYGDRAEIVTRAFTDRKVPLLWIGPPAVKPHKMDGGMAIIQQVLSERVPSAGGIFLSIREMTLGPDHSYTDWIDLGQGKIIHLRHSDGMHFSESGDRYLAKFVLKALRANPKTAPLFS